MPSESKTFGPATPTQYRDIVFRSKSEAILARNFDLLGWSWIYEPDQFIQSDLWKPDFWIMKARGSKPGFVSGIVEYKPCDPTSVYKDRLAQRFSEIAKTTPYFGFLMLVGNGFESAEPRFIEEWTKDGWHRWNHESLMIRLDEAKSFRFDLRRAA